MKNKILICLILIKILRDMPVLGPQKKKIMVEVGYFFALMHIQYII